MNKLTQAICIFAVVLIAVSSVAVISDDIDAEGGTADLMSVINSTDADSSGLTLVELDEDTTYTLDQNSGSTTKTKVVINGNGATLLLDSDSTLNYNAREDSMISVNGLNIKASDDSTGIISFSMYNWYYMGMSNCSFDNVLLFIGDSILDGKGTVALVNNTFSADVHSDTRFAVTVNAGNIDIRDNTVSGYGRGFNLNMNGGEDSLVVQNNHISNLIHTTKPIAFQLCEDLGDRTVIMSGNTVEGGYGISIYPTFTTTGEQAILLVDNNFLECTCDILYSYNNNSPEQHFDTSISTIGDNFIHNGNGTSLSIRYEDSSEAINDATQEMISQVTGAMATVEVTWYTPGETMHLDSVEDLMEFRDMVNSGINFKGETVVLDMGTYTLTGEWAPVGITNGLIDCPFMGTFDGSGSTIVGLTMTTADIPGYRGMDSGDYYAYGFFGGVVNGTVKNLTFTDYNISKPGVSSQNSVTAVAVGALLFSGEVSGIEIGEGTVVAVSRGAGVVGYIGGAKFGSEAPANPGADAVMGTITIANNINYADVKSNWTSSTHGTAGGIISTNNLKSMTGGKYVIDSNWNYGDISGYFAGGIMASDFSNYTVTEITDNRNYGDVSTTVTNNDAVALGISAVKNSNTSGTETLVSGNENYGAVSTSGGVASGICGTIYQGATVENNANYGNVEGYHVAAGIVTIAYGGIVSDNSNYGRIDVAFAPFS